MQLAARAEQYAERYRADGRVHATGVLTQAAADGLHRSLLEQRRWNLVFNRAGRHVDTDAACLRDFDREQLDTLHQIVHAQAAAGFQYYYKAIPVADAWHRGQLRGHPLARLYEFLNGPAFLGFARALTGRDDITFCDAQATRFEPGHFLNVHDDDEPEARRVAAYVLNLTSGWRPDWGGALLFHSRDDCYVEGFLPAMNALNVFAVPQRHSVEVVAPFARRPRLCVSGWLRAGPNPMLEDRVC